MLATGSPTELEAKLPFDILEVKARPRKVIRKVIEETEGIYQWRPVGDRLRLSIGNQNSIEPRLKKSLHDAGAEVSIFRRAKPIMDDVFIYMVEEQRSRV